MVQKTKTPYIC